MSYKFNPEELTSEKSLWDIHKLSKNLTPSKSQTIMLILLACLLAINVFLFDVEYAQILIKVRAWALMGFNFSITTLGFLIAGFTIFATLSKPEMMLQMMDHINKESGLPTLKYNFFAFMKVFVAYIGFSILYLTVILLGDSGGLIDNIVSLIPNSGCIKIVIVKTMYVYIGTSFFYLVLLLKTFVFNIYSIVMNSLRWEYYQPKNDE